MNSSGHVQTQQDRQVTIRRLDEGEPTQLYHRYPRESAPQPCYVSLDLEDGTLTAGVWTNIGPGTPESVWHNREVWWAIPPLRAEAANRLLDEIAPLAQQILDHSEVRWDGSHRVGRLDPDWGADRYDGPGHDAQAQIERICDDYAFRHSEDVVEVWEAGAWFAGLGDEDEQRRELGISPTTTDEELQALLDAEIADGVADEIEGGLEYLQRLRNEAPEAYCECGRVTGMRCEWAGDLSETVVVEWMPPYLRASHEAAGNRGTYPHNGAERLRVHHECADLIVEGEDGWAEVVEGEEPNA